MKKKLQLLFAMLIFSVMSLYAHAPPSLPGDASNGGTNGPLGGNGTPIRTGIILMTSLFAVYGTKKDWYNRERLEDLVRAIIKCLFSMPASYYYEHFCACLHVGTSKQEG